MVFNIQEDRYSQRHDSPWSNLLQARLTSLSGRRAPSWTTGTVEDFVVVEEDFGSGPQIVSTSQPLDGFFDTLVKQVRIRNPNAIGE